MYFTSILSTNKAATIPPPLKLYAFLLQPRSIKCRIEQTDVAYKRCLNRNLLLVIKFFRKLQNNKLKLL